MWSYSSKNSKEGFLGGLTNVLCGDDFILRGILYFKQGILKEHAPQVVHLNGYSIVG